GSFIVERMAKSEDAIADGLGAGSGCHQIHVATEHRDCDDRSWLELDRFTVGRRRAAHSAGLQHLKAVFLHQRTELLKRLRIKHGCHQRSDQWLKLRRAWRSMTGKQIRSQTVGRRWRKLAFGRFHAWKH